MSKTQWRVGLALALPIILGGIGVSGYYVFQSLRGGDALLRAEEAYSQGRWSDAKRNFGWYIARQPNDLEVLPRYIESCLNIQNNRRDNVRDAGRAHLRLAMSEPSDLNMAQEVVDFYRRHNLWRELEYAASVFLRNHPNDPKLAFNKALADGVLGRTSEAIAEYEGLIERGVAEPQAFGNLASLLLKQGYDERGRQVLDDAIARNPDDSALRIERIKYSLATQNVARAAEDLNAVLDSGEESLESLLTAASVYGAQREFETALAFAKRAVSEEPNSYSGHSLVVTSLLALERVDEAIAHLSNLDQFLLADNPQFYFMLAEIQIDAQELEAADRTIEAYRAVSPGEGLVFDYLEARKLLASGEASEAASKLAVVVEQVPELRVASYYLSIAYLDSGERERAKNTLELYLNANPNDQRARVFWDSVFAERSGDSVKAEAKDLLDSDTPYFASLLSVANSLNRQTLTEGQDAERLELTERLYRRAIKDSASVPDAYRELGIHLVRQGDVDGAREVLEDAYAAGIEPSSFHYLAAAIALVDGELDLAKKRFSDQLQLEALSFEDAVRWAALFARHEQMDVGLELLANHAERMPADELRQDFELVEVAIHMRFENFEEACAVIETLASTYAQAPAMIGRLNDYRIAIARLKLAPGESQDMALSEQLIEQVEHSEPDRAEAMILRAQLLLSKDPPDLEAAERLCAKASEHAEKDMYWHLVQTEIAYKRQQFYKALDHASKAHQVTSNRTYSGLVLARIQLQTQQLNDAVVTLQEVRESVPENPVALELLVRAYAGMGRFQDADKFTQQLQDLLDGQLPIQLQASLLVARGNWAAAEGVLRQMHESSPDDLWAIHHLAVALEQQDRRQEAEQFLNACLDQNPDQADLWVELGGFYLRNTDGDQLSDASLAFTQALAREQQYHRALRGLFEVQLRSNNPGAALGFCDRLLQNAPDDLDMIRQKALLLARLDGYESEALSAVDRAIEVSPLPEFYRLRGSLRLKLGDFADALEDFQYVEQSVGDTSGELNALMAETYLELDNLTLARSYYEAAKAKEGQLRPAARARLDRIMDRILEP